MSTMTMRKRRSQGRRNQNRRSKAGQSPLWVSLALIAANVMVYAAVLRHGFANFDDFDYVKENPAVAAGLTWRGVVWAFTTGYAGNWHPLTWLSHMLDVQLYGMY